MKWVVRTFEVGSLAVLLGIEWLLKLGEDGRARVGGRLEVIGLTASIARQVLS